MRVICDPEGELDCASLYHGRSPLGEMKGAGYARSHKTIATSPNSQYYVNRYTDYKMEKAAWLSGSSLSEEESVVLPPRWRWRRQAGPSRCWNGRRNSRRSGRAYSWGR